MCLSVVVSGGENEWWWWWDSTSGWWIARRTVHIKRPRRLRPKKRRGRQLVLTRYCYYQYCIWCAGVIPNSMIDSCTKASRETNIV